MQLTPTTRVALKHDDYKLYKILPSKVFLSLKEPVYDSQSVHQHVKRKSSHLFAEQLILFAFVFQLMQRQTSLSFVG